MLEVVILGRRGRKRNRAMYPNAESPRGPSRAEVAAGMPHRRSLPEKYQTHQYAESELGRMFLTGEIKRHHLLAGQRYAQVVGRYLATIAPPSRSGGRGRGFDCCAGMDTEEVKCICAARRADYDEAYEAVFGAGQQAAKAVRIVAVQDEPCPKSLFRPLIWGLSALAHCFGLTNVRKSDSRRN